MPIAAVIYTLLFGAIAAPIIKTAPLQGYLGEKIAVTESLSLSGLALVITGVIATLLATYAFRYSKPARVWAKVATMVACLLFVATLGLLPPD
jgi:hypothetical protein